MRHLALVTAAACVLLLLATAGGALASPWFDFFTGQRPRTYYPPRRPPPSAGAGVGVGSRSGRDRFKSICRTINADNYAFPGRVPYPSAPLCPF